MITKERKKILKTCEYCSKEFSTYTFSKQRFCSITCHYLNKKVKRYCDICGREVLITKSHDERNKGKVYCSRECYNKRRKGELKRLKRNTEYFKEFLLRGCECGITEYYLLHIHHKDGNHSNNNEENLEVVCANCHIKRHLRLVDGMLVYDPKYLTNKDIIKTINEKEQDRSIKID